MAKQTEEEIEEIEEIDDRIADRKRQINEIDDRIADRKRQIKEIEEIECQIKEVEKPGWRPCPFKDAGLSPHQKSWWADQLKMVGLSPHQKSWWADQLKRADQLDEDSTEVSMLG